MFSTNQVVDLIKAHKSGDEETFNQAIQKLIKSSETQNKRGVAKSLREVYSKPNDMFRRMKPSSVKTPHETEKRFSVQSHTGLTLDDVILSRRNVSGVNEIIKTWEEQNKLKRLGVSPTVRLLLHGQPGTGKTYLANAIAGSLGLDISYVDVSKLISSFLGETGKNISEVFSTGTKHVLFLDEFEALAKSRADNMDIGEAKRIVTAILQSLDSLEDDVLLIAATNHIEMVDSAIRRRFTHELNLDDIDLSSRERLFELYLKSVKMSEASSKIFARLSSGFTGHDIRLVCQTALRRNALDLDNITLEQQILRQIIETKYRQNRFDSKDEKAVSGLRADIEALRGANKKYFVYDTLEDITGIASSTIHYLMKNGASR